METAPAEFPILTALSRKRSGTLREVAAGVAMVVIWAALWSWLILGVGAPAAASVRRLSPPGGRLSEVALRLAQPPPRAP